MSLCSSRFSSICADLPLIAQATAFDNDMNRPFRTNRGVNHMNWLFYHRYRKKLSQGNSIGCDTVHILGDGITLTNHAGFKPMLLVIPSTSADTNLVNNGICFLIKIRYYFCKRQPFSIFIGFLNT